MIDVGVHLMFHLVEIKYYKFKPNGNTFVQLNVCSEWEERDNREKERDNEMENRELLFVVWFYLAYGT